MRARSAGRGPRWAASSPRSAASASTTAARMMRPAPGTRRAVSRTAWSDSARLALATEASLYEPKRLRLRILAVAGRLVRSARRRVLHIDPDWPWADTITPAHL
jgi:hypothetical protein